MKFDSSPIQPTYTKPSSYRSDPFPESSVGKTFDESFQSGVEAILAATKPQQPLTLQEARDRLAGLVSQISTINQSIENSRKSGVVPEHVLVRRKRASRARNILQQEATQLQALIKSMTDAERDRLERESKAAIAKSRMEAAWSAYLSAEDVLNEVERLGGTVGSLGQKYRKRSQSEVPLEFREQWQRTHANGTFVQKEVPAGAAAEPLKATPASLGQKLALNARDSAVAPNGQTLVRYTGKKR